jgi:uncharacterized protein YaeQ
MAIKATVFKAELQISDLDRGYYQPHDVTIARHPSETNQRMIVRLLSFILFADEQLSFTKGLSEDSEPDLWQHNYSGECEHWIELGTPDEKRLRRACGKAKRVTLVNYTGASSDIWWQQNESKLSRFEHLAVVKITTNEIDSISDWVTRTMQIQATIQDGDIWLTCGQQSARIAPIWLKNTQTSMQSN